MILGFKDQFHSMILEGSKVHTIRARRKIRPKSGEVCHCYGKVRQKGMHLLGRWPCVRVSEIVFTPVLTLGCICRGDGLYGMECTAATHMPSVINEHVVVTIDGEALSPDELDSLAWRDGFRPEGDDCPDCSHLAMYTISTLCQKCNCTGKLDTARGAFALMLKFWHAEKRLLDSKPWVGAIIYWDFEHPVIL